jgi:hypothetical protein
MKKPLILLLSLCLLVLVGLLSSCTYHSYYQSPFNANLETYHAVPLHSDPAKSANYASGVVTLGGANEYLRDHLYSFCGSLYQSRNFGYFQAYYGADISVGSYYVSPYRTRGDRPSAGMDTALINAAAGSKFFGGYGLSGGINFVLPLGRVGEWRVLGLSMNLQDEFGNYLRFRQRLPDSAANTIFKDHQVGTIGFSTELAFETHHGMVCLKWSLGLPLLDPKGHYAGNDSTNYGMTYGSMTVAVTRDNWTGFGQANIGRTALSMQLGFHYRLGWGQRKSGHSSGLW